MLPTLLLWLGQINILLALFNLVPGFPLDGGRILRAVLWGITGNLRRATGWATGAGQLFAWFLIGSGLAMMLGFRIPVFGTGFIGGLWIAFIGWFLNNAALLSYQQLVVRESLEDVPVAALMQTRFTDVPPDLSVDRLVEDLILHSEQRGFPVLSGERLAGMVCMEDVRKLERSMWPFKRVGDIMTPARSLICIGPQEPAYRALALLGDGRINQMPVVENGRVRGLIRREDILKWLSLRGKFDSRDRIAYGEGR
ncbi:MAG TPA: CBS domain-containing protein [Noviherbaspirillum sp.]|nr:CBS domain-containing protein [Noviherbaspirillum sp.]